MSLRTVHLHGRLADQYTKVIELDAEDMRAVVAGVNSNFPGFEQDFIDNEWHVVNGEFNGDDSNFIDQDELLMALGKTTEVHIFPKIEGSGGGFWKVVLGVGLIAFAWWAAPVAGGLGATAFSVGGMGITFGNIAMFGLSMAMGGLSSMMAPTPSMGDSMQAERAADRPSFMFNGAVNVMVAGGPVPIVYGEYETGSTVISAGIVVEKV